ncbi:hypothetical protein N9A80_01850 [Rhodopirellula sp.]|nr:hypothetical protein [Rhodopirellula sp.]
MSVHSAYAGRGCTDDKPAHDKPAHDQAFDDQAFDDQAFDDKAFDDKAVGVTARCAPPIPDATGQFRHVDQQVPLFEGFHVPAVMLALRDWFRCVVLPLGKRRAYCSA